MLAHQYQSPLGPLTLVFDVHGHLTRLHMEELATPSTNAEDTAACAPALDKTRKWLDAYFAHHPLSPKALPLAPQGTAFQQAVWQHLLTIPYGKTESYADVAKAVGSHPRAIGGAVGKNPIPLIIPCHRVMGKNGSLTGFSAPGGLKTKQKLLDIEQHHAA